VPNTWSGDVAGNTFMVRGEHYLQDKQKVPSQEPMFRVEQIEAYRTEARTLNITKLLDVQADTVHVSQL
jgi:hypothetical protein